MIQTYKTTLISKTQLTEDVFLFKFNLVDPTEFSFISGQYMIMMISQPSGETVRRLYSIASSNIKKGEFELLIKIMSDGCAGQYLSQIKIGELVIFQGPAGVFTLRESSKDKVLLVTGTGFAPVRSMLASLFSSENNIQKPVSQFHIFWGFPTFDEIYLLDELKEMVKINPNIHIYFCLSREQNLNMIQPEDLGYFLMGRITVGLEKVFIKNNFQFQNFDYYLCGSREVVDSLRIYCEQKTIPKEQVFFEKF